MLLCIEIYWFMFTSPKIDPEILNIAGAQGRPPQNMPQWHIDYFELKLLKKRSMQEGHSDPPFCFPESRK